MACSPVTSIWKSAPVSGGGPSPSPSWEFPGADPRHRAHQFRPPARGLEGVAARPIRRVREELVRSDLPLRQPVNQRHSHVGVAPAGWGHLYMSDQLGGVLRMAGLRHLYLVPLAFVPAVGGLRVVGRLQGIGPHLLRVPEGDGHRPFPCVVIALSGAPVPLVAHHTLLPQQPLQQPVLLQLGGSRATEAVHQPVEVPGTHAKPSATLPRAGVLVVGRFCFFLQVAPHKALWDHTAKLWVLLAHGPKEQPHRLTEQAEAG